MIKKVSTEDGDCLAITLHPSYNLDNIRSMTISLIELMKTCTTSETFHNATEDFYWVLVLLEAVSIPSDEQLDEFEKHFKTKS